jgi:hypothetical protein
MRAQPNQNSVAARPTKFSARHQEIIFLYYSLTDLRHACCSCRFYLNSGGSSLSRQIDSLFGRTTFPVPIGRELAGKALKLLRELVLKIAELVKKAKFPDIFPVLREFGSHAAACMNCRSSRRQYRSAPQINSAARH